MKVVSLRGAQVHTYHLTSKGVNAVNLFSRVWNPVDMSEFRSLGGMNYRGWVIARELLEDPLTFSELFKRSGLTRLVFHDALERLVNRRLIKVE